MGYGAKTEKEQSFGEMGSEDQGHLTTWARGIIGVGGTWRVL